jgi:rubrerythrin
LDAYLLKSETCDKILQILFLEARMSYETKLDIIKGAILLEHRGKSLYESAVKNTQIGPVKDLFEFLALEEDKHIELLEKQFKRITKNEEIILDESGLSESKGAGKIITSEIVNRVTGAGYEAAIIGAALEFEKKAVDYYSTHAASAKSKGEQKLYDWLAEWEKGHMIMLAELDKEIKEQIWYDNSFWPLD